ncbi:DUF3549 family protein [Aliivibrio fischeri]|uniref:DUF3549 family protein n=1 Tax=Aliivibrio fischeri TaxID=668 RepID=A0A6N3YZJ3_ALIFS|nr:DUF3549 family protein [Aliivibrio fischeri]MUK44044.1 DUF3549 family protein [Aliivibrio fischeri]MUK79413.1 DUF3549 family protein [Aliivibrio fischeri]MUK86689.1 DUF3549 family protein [Aliivibrio fischeri]
MDQIYTLTQLIQQSDCEYTIYDLGRRVQPISNKQFESIEAGQQPYPYPLQRHAHLAIAYWNDTKQPWIWFLKLPLDERSLLQQADIGNFIKYVIEAIGVSLSGDLSEEQQQKLSNNPYTFKPKDDKMAMFHSLLRAELAQPMSQYYDHAKTYLSGINGWDNWQFVGMQGLADVCANLDKDNNSTALRKALSHLPTTVLYATLGCLEHINLPEKLAQKQLETIQDLCDDKESDLFLLSAHIRALSGADKNTLIKALTLILASERLSHPEVLVAIAGRCWSGLEDLSVANLFLLRLAQTGDQQLFNQLFADLVMQPKLRMCMLQILHGEADPKLANALLKLQQTTKS